MEHSRHNVMISLFLKTNAKFVVKLSSLHLCNYLLWDFLQIFKKLLEKLYIELYLESFLKALSENIGFKVIKCHQEFVRRIAPQNWHLLRMQGVSLQKLLIPFSSIFKSQLFSRKKLPNKGKRQEKGANWKTQLFREDKLNRNSFLQVESLIEQSFLSSTQADQIVTEKIQDQELQECPAQTNQTTSDECQDSQLYSLSAMAE